MRSISEAEARIDVAGFRLEPQATKTLRCITENSGGCCIDRTAMLRTKHSRN